MLYFFAFFTALAITMILVPPLRQVATPWGLVDRPNQRKVHIRTVPRIGGIAMMAGFLVPFLMWIPLDRPFASILIGVLVLAAFGIWDDRNDLDYRMKFAGQLVAVGIAVFYGGIVIDHFPFFGLDALPSGLSIPITIIVLVGVTNAINLSDGLDGLAGGVAALSFGGVAFLAYIVEGAGLALAALAALGALLGFLRYNTWPARVFMGDAGSQYLGFVLGTLVVVLTQDVHSAMSPAVGLLLVGLPLLDTTMVMIGRLCRGRSPFSADRTHIHHRFLDLGFDHYEAVTLIYLAQATLVVAAVLLRYQSDAVLILLFLLFAGLTLGYFWFAPSVPWLRKHAGAGAMPASFTAQSLTWLSQRKLDVRLPGVIAILVAAATFVTAGFVPELIPADVTVMGAALLLVYGLWLSGWFYQRAPWVEKVVIYSTCAVCVYLLSLNRDAHDAVLPLLNAALVLLAVAVMLGVRFGRGHAFHVTPLDFLILFTAIVVPNLPLRDFDLVGAAIAKVIVLFYGIEFALGLADGAPRLLRIITLIALGVITMRGFIF